MPAESSVPRATPSRYRGAAFLQEVADATWMQVAAYSKAQSVVSWSSGKASSSSQGKHAPRMSWLSPPYAVRLPGFESREPRGAEYGKHGQRGAEGRSAQHRIQQLLSSRCLENLQERCLILPSSSATTRCQVLCVYVGGTRGTLTGSRSHTLGSDG